MREIERRYVVFGIDPATFRLPWRSIEQGYYMARDGVLRIRIINGREVEILKKTGHGQVREEHPLRLPRVDDDSMLALAKYLLRNAAFQLEKNRFKRDGWEIDVYKPPLLGLVIAEHETNEVTNGGELPPWITEAEELTDSVDNLMLAKLANQRRAGNVPLKFYPPELGRALLLP